MSSKLHRGYWQNWSGSVQGQPREVATPSTIEELARMVGEYRRTGRHIRIVGSGHSFTPLVQTDDVLLSLDRMQGVEAIDAERGTATVLAGTKLHALGAILQAHGVAQENLGDIDVQSIAGAFSTGTHGTGTRFGILATQIERLTLVTASGEIVECSADQQPEIFKAAQVSLGTLGVIAKMTLRVVPAKRLHYTGARRRLSDCLDHLDQYKQESTHFEFLWMPHTDWTQTKFMNETDRPASKNTLWGQFNKIVLENGVFWLLSEWCRLFPSASRGVSRFAASAIASVDETNYSYKLYATPRMVVFNEMEYNIPAEHAGAVIGEIRDMIAARRVKVHFPLECRFVKGDDIWLSPAYQRDSAYIAVHMYRGMPYKDYFAAVEEIFRRYDGRPHWGKIHTRTAAELAALYPRWNDFRRIRAQLDPDGVFLNPYLRSLLEADTPVPTADVPASQITQE